MKHQILLVVVILILSLDFGYENFNYMLHIVVYAYCAINCNLRAVKLNLLDLCIVLFFTYAFSISFISSGFRSLRFEDISCIGYCFVYLYFRKIPNSVNNESLQYVFSVILTAVVSLNLIGTLLNGSFLINNPFPFPNTTVAANFLAIIMVPFFNVNSYRNLSFWYSVVFALVNQARIFIFLFSAAWLYHRDKKLKILIPSLFALLAVLFLFLKEKSTGGRMFILNNTLSNYKIFLPPQGIGNYKSYYIELQAEILRTMDRNDLRFMSVDYPNYVFNDFFQILIELGLIGLFLYVLIFFISANYVKRYIPAKYQLQLYSFLIIYIIISSASYPFYVEIFKVTLLLVLAVVSSNNIYSNVSVSLQRIINPLKVVFFLYLSACFFFLTNISHKFQTITFTYLPFKDKFLYKEAYEAYRRNEFSKSVQFLNKTSRSFVNMDKYIMLGNCYDRLKRRDMAIESLSLATYYYPNRFKPKYYLFHYKVQNKIDATLIAQDILNTPTKVPNSEIIKLKDDASLYLDTSKDNL